MRKSNDRGGRHARRGSLKPGGLSRWAARWQSAACIAALLVLADGGTAAAAPGGALGTLPLGRWVCELPGDAMGVAGVRQPDYDFDILHSSRYEVKGDTGHYLLTGDLLQMTGGPFDGARYRRVSLHLVRKLGEDGRETALRCVRQVLNNGG